MTHARPEAEPDWQALTSSAGQLWLAPIIVAATWWNATLETWLDISRELQRHRAGPPRHE